MIPHKDRSPHKAGLPLSEVVVMSTGLVVNTSWGGEQPDFLNHTGSELPAKAVKVLVLRWALK